MHWLHHSAGWSMVSLRHIRQPQTWRHMVLIPQPWMASYTRRAVCALGQHLPPWQLAYLLSTFATSGDGASTALCQNASTLTGRTHTQAPRTTLRGDCSGGCVPRALPHPIGSVWHFCGLSVGVFDHVAQVVRRALRALSLSRTHARMSVVPAWASWSPSSLSRFDIL